MPHTKEPPSSTPSLEKHLDTAVTHAGPRKTGKAFLMVAAGEAAGTVFPLTQSSLLIGRSSEAEVRINEQAISNEHARLEMTGTRCTIVDLGSTNGTYVNGQRIDGSMPLSGGDTIRTGSTTFTFVMRDMGMPQATLKLGEPDPRKAGAATRIVVPPRGPALRSLAVAAPPRYEEDDALSLTDVVHTVKTYWTYARRYGWLALTCMCFGISLGIAQARFSPPPGSAWFEMTLASEGRTNNDNEEDGPKAFMAPESTFKSLPLIKRSLSELGLVNPSDSVAADVQAALSFEQTGYNSKLYRGEYKDTTAERAREFLGKHVDMYINAEIDKILKVLRTDAAFDREQAEKAQKGVGVARDRLVTFMEEHPEAVPKDAKLPNEPRAVLSAGASPARLDAAIVNVEQSLNGALRAMQTKKARPYVEQAAEAESKIAEAKSRGLGDRHPEVKNWVSLASTMRAKAGQILSAEPGAAEQSLDPDVSRLRQELAELKARRAQAGPPLPTGPAPGDMAAMRPMADERALAGAQSVAQLKVQYAELAREYERAKTEHDALLKKRETTDRQLERERTSAEARYNIITPPTLQRASTWTNMLKRAGFGGAVGFGLALIAAACLEVRRTLIARGHL